MAKKKPEAGNGPTNFCVTTVPSAGLIFLNFDNPVAWVALTPDMAKKLGEDLVQNANEIKRNKGLKS